MRHELERAAQGCAAADQGAEQGGRLHVHLKGVFSLLQCHQALIEAAKKTSSVTEQALSIVIEQAWSIESNSAADTCRPRQSSKVPLIFTL